MDRIGKYQITRKIAEGHFAVLFEAKEPSPPDGLGRRVALKLCSANDELLRQRFGREVELIAQLGHHPNIASAYDIGYFEGAPYLVEEYLPGEDLRHKIERKDDLSPVTKVGLLLQTAKGLQFAHSKEIVHRDIKPENLRISPSGHVKIIDFGIGKAVSSEATRLTMDGTIMGTLGYLAPEQLRGKADLRSDIFSFGVMAYELLTYSHPFTASTLREQFRVLMEQNPAPMSSLWAACPPGLEQVVDGCLEKDVEKRTQTFDQVVEGLRKELRNLETAAVETEAEQDSGTQATFILDQETLQSLSDETKGTGDEAPDSATVRDASPVTPEESDKGQPTPSDVSAADTEVKPAESVPSPPPPPPVEESKPVAPKATDTTSEKKKLTEPAEQARPAAPSSGTPETVEVAPPVASTTPPGSDESAAAAKEKSRKQPPPTSSGRASAKSLRWVLFVVPVVLVAAVAAFWLFRNDGGQIAEAPAPETTVQELPAVPTPSLLGTLVVDAFPWASVSRVEDTSLTEVPLAQPCTTPCSLELEPGAYTAFLVHPDYPDTELECEFSVTAGETTNCRVSFDQPSAAGYFKAVGWWK
jgi:serine/threonine-protein kinase